MLTNIGGGPVRQHRGSGLLPYLPALLLVLWVVLRALI